jgi:hypothetical protein
VVHGVGTAVSDHVIGAVVTGAFHGEGVASAGRGVGAGVIGAGVAGAGVAGATALVKNAIPSATLSIRVPNRCGASILLNAKSIQ